MATPRTKCPAPTVPAVKYATFIRAWAPGRACSGPAEEIAARGRGLAREEIGPRGLLEVLAETPARGLLRVGVAVGRLAERDAEPERGAFQAGLVAHELLRR